MLTSFYVLQMICVHFVSVYTGANPLQTNGLGHAARAYAKEGEVSKVLQEWEGKVWHAHKHKSYYRTSN